MSKYGVSTCIRINRRMDSRLLTCGEAVTELAHILYEYDAEYDEVLTWDDLVEFTAAIQKAMDAPHSRPRKQDREWLAVIAELGRRGVARGWGSQRANGMLGQAG